jgi:peptidoglycan/LPS O-acetylase OafA/YrhL
MEPELQIHRYFLLDGLRGLAAFFVMFGHLSSHAGHIGIFVDFFFVLSGFVLSPSISRYANLSKKKFIVIRILRFYPTLIIMFFFIIFFERVPLVRDTFDVPVNGIFTYFGAFFLLQIFYAPFTNLNSPLWSLSAEFWVNIMAIFLVSRVSKFKLAIVGAIFFISAHFADQFFDLGWQPWLYFEALGRSVFGFFLGMILFSRISIIRKSLRYTKLLLILFIFSIVAYFQNEYHLIYLLGAPISYLLIAEIIKMDEKRVPNPILRICRYIGKISFPVYAWHYLIMEMNIVSGFWLEVIFTLLISDLSQRFIEKRLFRKMSNLFLKSKD